MNCLDTEDLVTFDQLLWWKVLMIRESEPPNSGIRQVVLRLGSFHKEMSLIGSIGHLIAESGLKELLEFIYAPTAVEHFLLVMLSQKPYELISSLVQLLIPLSFLKPCECPFLILK